MRAIVIVSVFSLTGCALAPLRFIDAAADGARDEATLGDAPVEASPDASSLDATADVGAEVFTEAGPDAGQLTGPAGTPLGLCTSARAIGSTAIGVRPALPWSNTALTAQRTVFQGVVESGWTDVRIVVVNHASDTVVYSAALTAAANRVDHHPPREVRFGNGVYRWMLCARDAMNELRHSAEWRFRVSATAANNEGRAGMIPLFSDMTGDGFPEVIVGAPSSMSGGMRRGATRVWSFGDMGLVSGAQSAPVTTNLQDGDQFGTNVALLGDINGDGFADAAVTLPGYRPSGAITGGVRVFTGRADRAAPLAQVGTFLSAPAAAGSFGASIAGLGDINGDGLDDFAVGAPADSSDTGLVRIYSGVRTNGFTQSQSFQGATAGEQFGFGLAGIGDINGDGLNDFAVGSIDGGAAQRGSVSIWLGTREMRLASSPSQRIEAPVDAMMATDFGYSISAAGDVNHDGYADMLVGSPAEGKVYLYLSTGSAMGTTPMQTFSGSPVDQFGRALLGGMDLDADHHADIVIGATRAAGGEGAAYVYRGAQDGSLSEARTIRGADRAENSTGISLAVVGDVFWGRAQSAGCPTVLVGAPGSIALAEPGRVFAVHGDPIVGLDNEPLQREINAGAGELSFGSGVGGARAR